MRFKVGDKVKVTLSEDVDAGPGYNSDMEDLLGSHRQILTLSVKTSTNGWWRCVEDDSVWYWDDRWMEKVNKFKGNK